MSPRIRTLAFSLFVASLMLMAPKTCWAVIGAEYQAQEEDLVVAVDGRWAGCMSGGYYPIRVRIQNRADTRDIRVNFRPDDQGLPAVSRIVNCPQNATTVFTLPIPMVGAMSHGELQFSHPRGRLKDLSKHMSLAEPDYTSGRPGLLVISSANVDCTQFESAVSSTMGVAHVRYGASSSENHFVSQPVMLPNTAVSYSGLDLIAVPLKTFQSLSIETRDVILSWTRTGGTLMVYEAGEQGFENPDIIKLAGLDRTTQRSPWQQSQVAQRVNIQVRQFDQYGNEQAAAMVPATGENTTAAFVWKASDKTFASREYGFGRLAVFEANPFPGTPHEWAWFFKSSGVQEKGRMSQRLGVHGRSESGDFMQFLIPGIQSVPVYSFLFFITIFAFVIGPLNYYLLAKRNRLNALILTVPALAIVTSVVLFVFSAVSHGFTVKARVRSLTVLDQGLQSAVVTSRQSLYAGMVPSDGLKFSPETSVIPIWPQEGEFESGSVDWTQTQHLTSGWLRARTKTQFLTLGNHDERGRLTIEAPSNGQLQVTNGLEWSLDSLIVGDDSGNLFFGTNVAAGTPATLKPATDEQRVEFVKALVKSAPAIPEEYSTASNINMFSGMGRSRRYRYGYYGHSEQFYLQNGQMEKLLQDARVAIERGSSSGFPMNRRYFATMKTRPGLETGTATETIDEWHGVIGFY